MPRTRDLILFVVTGLFLLLAILVTVARQDSLVLVPFSDELPSATGTTLGRSHSEFDRSVTIARLKEKIADELVLEHSPSVPGEEPVATTLASEHEAGTVAVVSRTDCAVVDDGFGVADRWPRSDVRVVTSEGVRAVVAQDAFGTLEQLITLPIGTRSSGQSHCLDSEVVGVTLSGSLIFNNDAIVYSTVGAGTQIGFARDGVPIYGRYNGATDACGGYVADGEYRYSLAGDRNFIIGCFAAPPAQFTW